MDSQISFERFYFENTPKWDSFFRYNPGARHRRRILLELLEPLSFSSVIDVGCGNAELLNLLQPLRPQAKFSGLDISASVIEANQKAFSQFKFFSANLGLAPLESRYDLVICSEVIEHVPDQEKFFDHLVQAVNPGGFLLLSCPTGKIFKTEKNFGHLRHPLSSDIRKWVKQFGCVVKKEINWGFPFYSLTKEITNLNADYAMETFASGQKYGFFQKAISEIIYLGNFLNPKSTKLGCQLFFLIQRT